MSHEAKRCNLTEDKSEYGRRKRQEAAIRDAAFRVRAATLLRSKQAQTAAIKYRRRHLTNEDVCGRALRDGRRYRRRGHHRHCYSC